MTKSMVREVILERDGYVCQCCHGIERLEVHHMIPIMHGGKNEWENLITLCRRCHINIEPTRRHRIEECTTFSLSRENHEKLKALGKMGNSFNDIITELLELKEKKK